MDFAGWVQILLAAGTVASAVFIYITMRRDGRKETATGADEHLRVLAHTEYEPLRERLGDQAGRMTHMGDRLGNIEALLQEISAQQRAVSDRVAIVETKVSLSWQAYEQMAVNMAKILHQPDPARAHVDALLEAFMEGTLTPEEKNDLKKILVEIRNWEPGKPASIPVIPGEATAAAILLGILDLIDPARTAAIGHASHRKEASGEQHA